MENKPRPKIPLRPDQYVDDCQLKRLIAENNVVLIDVRSPAEIETSGKIACSKWMNIPFDDVVSGFEKSDAEFKEDYGEEKPPPPGGDVVIMCRTGRRSSIALTELQRFGYSKTRDLKGGYNEWTKEE